MSTFSELAAQRESCRSFERTRPVEDEKLRQIIEIACLAPSACNSQPWHFTVVNSPDLAASIAKCLQGMNMNSFASNCPAFIIVNEEKATLSAAVGGKIKQQHYAGYDIGLATAHICFAATELGLSTCIIGWFDDGGLKKLTGIPAKQKISLVIAVGYAATENLRKKIRKPIDEIATFLPILQRENTGGQQ